MAVISALQASCSCKLRSSSSCNQRLGLIIIFRTNPQDGPPKLLNLVRKLKKFTDTMHRFKDGSRFKVSTAQKIKKLSRSIIDDERSTVILRRCNGTDRRYRPCSPVGGTEPTVDIDRDQPTGRLIGGLVSIITGVLGPFLTTCGTIDFLVDDYLGPFFITVGTVGQWSFLVFFAGKNHLKITLGQQAARVEAGHGNER